MSNYIALVFQAMINLELQNFEEGIGFFVSFSNFL